MSRIELALVRFPHVTDAAEVFAAGRDRWGPEPPWIRQSGLVEHHHNGHWILRGTFAGHYLDIDEAFTTPSPELLKGSSSAGLSEPCSAHQGSPLASWPVRWSARKQAS